ncbi:MAG: PIN domain-containing protein [Pyramidobacter sp.]|nr:PIN domain-containing protein [Pyramidobacter sp.]
MRLLIDANIVLDVLMKREPHYPASAMVWKLCETEQAEGYVSTLTFANLVYVMRKELSPVQIMEVHSRMKLIFRFAGFASADLSRAASLQWDDFEDAVQSVIAERLGADWIVTRNVRDFKRSRIMAVTPAELLARI